MMQKIYEMPVWNAFNESNVECPLCSITEQSEKRLVNEILTQMTNDPDFNSNLGIKYTFCKEHFLKLYRYYNKSGLALLVEQLLKFNADSIKSYRTNINNSASKKHTLLDHLYLPRSKNETKLQCEVNKYDCYICSKLEEYTRSYMEVMMDLWKENFEFTSLYSNSKGLCMNHYHEVMSLAPIYFKDESTYKDFADVTLDIQKRNIERLEEELHKFTYNCNHTSIEEPWENLKDALPRSIQKLAGSFEIK